MVLPSGRRFFGIGPSNFCGKTLAKALGVAYPIGVLETPRRTGLNKKLKVQS